MGIFGLSAFVNEHVTLGTQYTWSSDSQQDKHDHFIIDGNAFTYHYAMKTNFNWVHGGQYTFFADTIRRDIAAMQRAGIRLVFLFDGALPHDKEYTRMKRYRSYIERAELLLAHLDQINNNLKTQESGIQHAGDMYLIPPLMLEVCLQTIRDLGLNPIVCQGEADGRVVKLADKYQGYVISKDSDMHVYPRIGKGYIPLNTLSIFSQVNNDNDDIKDKVNISYSTVKATIYHPEQLASLLHLNNVALLPLLGAILGNDYLDPQLVRYPIMEWCSSRNMTVKNKLSYWPKCVAEYLRDTCNNNGNGLPDLTIVAENLKTLILKSRENNSTASTLDGLEHALITSIYRYDPESALLIGHADPEEEEQDDTTLLPENISELGKMSRSIVDCLVTRTFWATLFIEDFQKESSWVISRPLRQCLYTLLLSNNTQHDDNNNDQSVSSQSEKQPPSVKEYIREKHHIGEMVISGLSIDQIIQQASTSSSVSSLTIQQIINDKQASTQLLYNMHYSNEQQVQDYINELDNNELQSFVLCLRYLIGENANQGTLVKNYEIVGLIVGMMMTSCTDDNNNNKMWSEHKNKEKKKYNTDGNTTGTTTRPALKKQVLHLTAQYQSVVFCSHLLSQALCTPYHLRGKASLEHMYDGVNMHQYLQLARRGANIGSLLGGTIRAHELGGLFWKIYRATTTGLADKLEQVYDYGIPITKTTIINNDTAIIAHQSTTYNNNINDSSLSPDWLKPRNIKKRSNNNNNNDTLSGKNPKRLATTNNNSNSSRNKNKKSTPVKKNGGNNIFDVLSFGCNFDDDDD